MSQRFVWASRVSPLTALTWTHGGMTINPATGVPVILKLED